MIIRNSILKPKISTNNLHPGNNLAYRIISAAQKKSNSENSITPNEYINNILNHLDIHYEFDEKEIQNIPKKGSFIVLANNPHSYIDKLIIYNIITKIRPDFKIVTHSKLNKMTSLADCFLPYPKVKQNKNGINYKYTNNNVLQLLSEENGLGFFILRLKHQRFQKQIFSDSVQQDEYIQLIQQVRVPVIPIHISYNIKVLYKLLENAPALLQTVTNPVLKENNNTCSVKIRLGKPLQKEEQSHFQNFHDYKLFLKTRLQSLSTKKTLKKNISFLKKEVFQENIIAPIDPQLIKKEIINIEKDHIYSHGEKFSLYCSHASDIPNILQELGRLREITFRAIGEGTNKSSDIDEYDKYYNHLILWDKETEKIVGSYRIGKGKDIMKQYGSRGFYTSSLFEYDISFNTILNSSLELGRSFITKEYQKNIHSLFLLWKGLLLFLLQNPDYQYLLGPVSISNSYSDFSKQLLVEYLKLYHFNYDIASQIKPRNKKKPYKNTNNAIQTILQAPDNKIKFLDKWISEIETDMKIPVLLKKYLSLNGKILGFNVDPQFNGCVDGLLLLNVKDIPEETLLDLSKDIVHANKSILFAGKGFELK